MSAVGVRRAIYGKLAGDTTLTAFLGAAAPGFTKGIYYQEAPDEANYPYLIFSKQSGTPTYAFDNDPALTDEVWLIKGVDHTEDADKVDGIESRLKALLNDAALSISGVNLLYLRWESDVSYAETADGERYIHAGALFRLSHD